MHRRFYRMKKWKLWGIGLLVFALCGCESSEEAETPVSTKEPEIQTEFMDRDDVKGFLQDLDTDRMELDVGSKFLIRADVTPQRVYQGGLPAYTVTIKDAGDDYLANQSNAKLEEKLREIAPQMTMVHADGTGFYAVKSNAVSCYMQTADSQYRAGSMSADLQLQTGAVSLQLGTVQNVVRKFQTEYAEVLGGTLADRFDFRVVTEDDWKGIQEKLQMAQDGVISQMAIPWQTFDPLFGESQTDGMHILSGTNLETMRQYEPDAAIEGKPAYIVRIPFAVNEIGIRQMNQPQKHTKGETFEVGVTLREFEIEQEGGGYSGNSTQTGFTSQLGDQAYAVFMYTADGFVGMAVYNPITLKESRTLTPVSLNVVLENAVAWLEKKYSGLDKTIVSMSLAYTGYFEDPSATQNNRRRQILWPVWRVDYRMTNSTYSLYYYAASGEQIEDGFSQFGNLEIPLSY